MNYNDLKDKTIFDFCADNSVLSKITGFPNLLYDKESMEYIKSYTPLVHSQMLQKLAIEISNHELYSAAKDLEHILWKEWDSAQMEASKYGRIID